VAEHGFNDPALTVALAMAMGVLAQVVARHLRLPGIVVLLIAGVGLGPDGANLIRPSGLGSGLHALVGLAVAVILFEGGLKLNLKALRAQAKAIRRLVTIGAIVTALGGALAARLVMGWPWQTAALFGTLVIVTGPTVINPLLHRIRLHHRPATILEAEGIFIDAVGATIAAVALEVAIAPSAESLGHGALDILVRIGLGAIVGLVGGGLLALLLLRRRIIPTGLQNVLALAFAVAIFQLSNAVLEESGITAVIVAGMVAGNVRGHAFEGLVDFKEQLVALFIATLFVLLSADVRLADVASLGLAGVLTVVILMVVVRPITVAVSTIGTELPFKEKAFLSWLAPRGIVAAAMASLFAAELEIADVEGGRELRALVFLVIAATVSIQGLSGGPVASLLGVRRAPKSGYVILGANAVGLQLANLLRDAGEEIVIIDANRDACRAAQEEGFKIVYGNALQERTFSRARAEGRAAFVAVTENENVNFLFARRALDQYPGTPVFVALETGESGVTNEMVAAAGAQLLFSQAGRIQRWRHRFSVGVEPEHWTFRGDEDEFSLTSAPEDTLLAMAGSRKGKVFVIPENPRFRRDDRVAFAFARASAGEQGRAWLLENGWVPPVDESSPPDPTEDLSPSDPSHTSEESSARADSAEDGASSDPTPS
jgi:NhaP-type Na+/H+ or K+/H+ antiporter